MTGPSSSRRHAATTSRLGRARNRALAFALAAGCASAAQAAFLHNDFGLPAPDQALDFEALSVPANQPVTDQLIAFGVTFFGAYSDPDPNDYPHVIGHRIGNFQAGLGESPRFTIDFTNVIGRAAFAFVSAPEGRATFEALLHGAVVELGFGDTSAADPTNYYGFEGIAFDQIRISVVSSDRTFQIDNLQTAVAAPVPEPETWALMMAGLAIIARSAQKARRRQEPAAAS